MKRQQGVISWDEFFMGIAKLASQRSKDPDTQHGVCIIDPYTRRILSVGYNGLPHGLSDEGLYFEDWDNPIFVPKEGLVYDYWEKPQKYDFSAHAEENAFANTTTDLKGSVLYLYSEKGYYPCSTCARGIAQRGIIQVIMNTAIQENTDKYDWNPTKHILKRAGVQIRILNGGIVNG